MHCLVVLYVLYNITELYYCISLIHTYLSVFIHRSLGVLAYVLLTGCSPFGGETKQETYSNITTGSIDFGPEFDKIATADGCFDSAEHQFI